MSSQNTITRTSELHAMALRAARAVSLNDDYVHADSVYTQMLNVIESEEMGGGYAVVVLCNRSQVRLSMEMPKMAYKDAKRALDRNPNNQTAALKAGQALCALGRESEALRVYTTTIEHVQTNSTLTLGDLDVTCELLREMEVLQTLERQTPPPNTPVSSAPVAMATHDQARPTGTRAAAGSVAKTPETAETAETNERTDTGMAANAVETANTTEKDGLLHLTKTAETAETAERADMMKIIEMAATAERLNQGFRLVNEGRLDEALAVFTDLLKEAPQSWTAWLGVGTAQALKRDLIGAEFSFTKCIELNAPYADTWRRRAQVRGAMQRYEEAIEDYLQAQTLDQPECSEDKVLSELETSNAKTLNQSDTSSAIASHTPDSDVQLGMLYHRIHNYRRARVHFEKALEYLSGRIASRNTKGPTVCIKGAEYRTDPSLLSETDREMYTNVWFSTGVCENTMGHVECAILWYMKLLDIAPNNSEKVLSYLGQAYKDWGNYAKAQDCYLQILPTAPTADYLNQLGLLYYLSGAIAASLGVFERVLSGAPTDRTALYYRALCLHGLGRYTQAETAYTRLLQLDKGHLGGYNRECCRYIARTQDMCTHHYHMDTDIHARVREGWCGKQPYSNISGISDINGINGINVDVLGDTGDSHSLVDTQTQSAVEGNVGCLSADVKALVATASKIGTRIQYQSPGFLSNVKQHRMAGLAMIDTAQALRSAWTGDGKHGGLHTETSGTSAHSYSWRDIFHRIVRWRQISEPNDPVFWIDKLSETRFKEGFGSHTPMLVGQTLVARYHSYLPRALKKILTLYRKQVGLTEDKDIYTHTIDRETVPNGLLDVLHDNCGKDFYVVTPCYSTLRRGYSMEGTRLMVQKSPPEGYEVSIRTPSTPARWHNYDAELTHAFTRLTDHMRENSDTIYVPRSMNNTGCRLCRMEGERDEEKYTYQKMETILPLALDIVFYWYNFMPLTRGGAAVGFIALHAIVLAVGLEITASPPFQTQLDWEAILCPNPATYQERLLPWLRRVVKPVCRATSAVGMGHAHTPKHTPCDGHATHETPGWVACTGDTKRAGVGGARESRIGSTTPHSEGTAVYDTHSDRTVVCDTNSAQIGEVGEVTYNRSSTREAEGRGQDMHKNNPPICVGDGIHTCSLQHATEPTRARVRGGARRCTPMGGRLDTAVCAGSTGPAAGCTYAEGCEAECVFATGQSCGCGFSVSECTCASVRIPECGSSPRCTHGDVGIGSDKEGRGVVCMCRCAPEDVPMCECVVCAVAVSDRLPTPRAMVLALNADLERYIDIKVN